MNYYKKKHKLKDYRGGEGTIAPVLISGHQKEVGIYVRQPLTFMA